VSPVAEVRILGLPVRIHEATSEHGDALRREFALMREARPDADEVPQRLDALIEQLSERFSGFNDEAEERLRVAVERGEPTVDLTFRVPVEARDGALQLDALFDEAEEFCRSGTHLLTLVAPPEVTAYRRWFLGQFVTQIDGADPVPWAAAPPPGVGSAEEPEPAEQRSDGPPMLLRFTADLDVQTAPDLRDELQRACADRPAWLVLDLSEVQFVDSVGIGVILAALRRMSEWDGHLSVRLSPTVRRTFAIAGLDALVDDSSDTSTDPPDGSADLRRAPG
jgi:anti-anti-sigma factor